MRGATALIIGAGIGGLAAALALQRAGYRVRVFEQSATLGDVGAGLSITPNAGRALVSLGLGDALLRIGNTPTHGAIRHFATGATLVALPQDRSLELYGIPLYHVHRADLHRALCDAVVHHDAAAIYVGHVLQSIEMQSSGVCARFANGAAVHADWLVGCDGIRSTVRAVLFGDARPNFTGFVAWRGLLPSSTVAPELREPPLCMTVGPRRMLMRYPVRDGSLINIVAIARRDAWAEEGWSVPAIEGELATEFADFESCSRALLAAIPAEHCFKWGLFDRDPLPTWAADRVLLLGDAAHPLPPFTGQGAAMALEDAACLGAIAAATNDPTQIAARLVLARRDRVARVLEMSRARAALYFADDPEEQVKALASGMAELRTLYAYDAASAGSAVSQQ